MCVRACGFFISFHFLRPPLTLSARDFTSRLFRFPASDSSYRVSLTENREKNRFRRRRRFRALGLNDDDDDDCDDDFSVLVSCRTKGGVFFVSGFADIKRVHTSGVRAPARVRVLRNFLACPVRTGLVSLNSKIGMAKIVRSTTVSDYCSDRIQRDLKYFIVLNVVRLPYSL